MANKTKIFREYDGQNFVDPADAPTTVRRAKAGQEQSLIEYNNQFSLSNLDQYDSKYVQSITEEVPFGGGSAQKPNWVDGTATQGQSTVNRRAPIVPIPSAILVGEDDASADTKRPLGSGDSTRSVVDRTTGRTRTEEEEEQRLKGAVLLR